MYLARNGVIGRPLCRPRLHAHAATQGLRVAASFNQRSGWFMHQANTVSRIRYGLKNVLTPQLPIPSSGPIRSSILLDSVVILFNILPNNSLGLRMARSCRTLVAATFSALQTGP